MFDRHDFLKCYEGCFPKIEILVKSTLGKYYLEGDEEDIFQNALEILFVKSTKNELQLTTDVCGYIYGIARNLSLELLRKSKAKEKNEENYRRYIGIEIPTNDPDDKVKALRICMEKLPETKKKMMLARYWKKLSMDEIASMFGFDAAVNVRMQLHRAINNLRDCVKQSIKIN